VAIDDALMGINSVIRGDDHLSNTAKQIIVYKALGFDIPKFYHVAMILNPEGKKLSKRDGATDCLEYRDMGYLPEALINFLVRLGWSYGDQEIFTMSEMLELFNPDDINKSASAYNAEKLLWLNSHYIKNSSNERLESELAKFGLILSSHDKKEILLDSLKERAKTLVELKDLAKEILAIPKSYDEKGLKKGFKAGDEVELLKEFRDIIANDNSLHLPNDFDGAFHKFLDERGLKFGKLGLPLRLALTGITSGISIMDIMAIIGRDESINRIDKLIDILK
jgi:glutamyl-tRNA synthetase